MRNLALITAMAAIMMGCLPQTGEKDIAGWNEDNFIDSTDMTNNFYDNTETYSLPVKELIVEGEIANPGKVDFSQMKKYKVIVKETLLNPDGGDRFTGAFRYDGYSLFDILEKRVIKKSNAEEFNQIIDLYIEVENETGDKVVFSWGEIFYPNNLHKIIIACGVARIVPSKTGELWDIPVKSRIVASSDLITERNISDPVKITVRSYPKSFKTVKGMAPMYSPVIALFNKSSRIGEVNSIPENVQSETYNTIFYGRGKGIHSTLPFTGPLVKEMLKPFYPVSRENLQKGIMCFTGLDGYRCAISYSELFNRNDQQEFLVVKSAPGEDGGLFRILALPDFFSDRAIKSVSEIHLGYSPDN